MRRMVTSFGSLPLICSPHRTAGTGYGSALTERWRKVTSQGLTPNAKKPVNRFHFDSQNGNILPKFAFVDVSFLSSLACR